MEFRKQLTQALIVNIIDMAKNNIEEVEAIFIDNDQFEVIIKVIDMEQPIDFHNSMFEVRNENNKLIRTNTVSKYILCGE